jgi:regulator of sirC expression with transglutaminase-like and TPR domain
VSRHNGRVRQWVRLDKEATNALALYVSGRKYAQEEKWALAVLHWEAAAAQKPSDPQYAKDLGLALARLGRYEQAVAALERGQEHHPADAEFRSLLELIEREKKR